MKTHRDLLPFNNLVSHTRIVGIKLQHLRLQTFHKLFVIQQCCHHCPIDGVQNRTEQLRKLVNFIDYYLDKFNQNGVFIRHKHRVAKQRCSRNHGERALSSKLVSCLGIVQLPLSGVEHMSYFYWHCVSFMPVSVVSGVCLAPPL